MGSKKKYNKVTIRPSRKSGKKYDAVFSSSSDPKGRTKTVSFGSKGMSDFTKHKDLERKKRYMARHKARENWNDPTSAGALSRWILWNKPSFQASVASYKRKFGFK